MLRSSVFNNELLIILKAVEQFAQHCYSITRRYVAAYWASAGDVNTDTDNESYFTLAAE